MFSLSNLFLVLAFIDEAAPADGGAPGAAPPGGNLLQAIWPFLLILPLFYLLVIRPGRRQERDRQSLIGNTKKNDKVYTTSGIIGTVVSISDDELVIKVDDNVRLRMVKGSILRNITQEEALKALPPRARPPRPTSRPRNRRRRSSKTNREVARPRQELRDVTVIRILLKKRLEPDYEILYLANCVLRDSDRPGGDCGRLGLQAVLGGQGRLQARRRPRGRHDPRL